MSARPQRRDKFLFDRESDESVRVRFRLDPEEADVIEDAARLDIKAVITWVIHTVLDAAHDRVDDYRQDVARD